MKPREFEERIDAAREDGWRVAEDGDRRVVMKRTNFGSRLGHLLVGAATVWWSFGLGNVAYALYEYVQHTEYKVIYSDDADEDPMEALRRRYARGEIGEAELERRTERLLELEHRGVEPVEGEPSESDRRGSAGTSEGRFERLRKRLRNR